MRLSIRSGSHVSLPPLFLGGLDGAWMSVVEVRCGLVSGLFRCERFQVITCTAKAN